LSLIHGVLVKELEYGACFAGAFSVAISAQQVAVSDFVVSAVLPSEASAGFGVVRRSLLQGLSVVVLQPHVQGVSVAVADELGFGAAVWAFVGCDYLDWGDGVWHGVLLDRSGVFLYILNY